MTASKMPRAESGARHQPAGTDETSSWLPIIETSLIGNDELRVSRTAAGEMNDNVQTCPAAPERECNPIFS
jgi:hypothetical protein